MRFVLTGEFNRNRLLQTIVVLYCLYVAGLWLTNALLFFSKMDLTYTGVVAYYLGAEEQFTAPRSYRGLLEVSHYHLFAFGMLIMVMTHLMLFVPLSNRTKLWLIVTPFLSGLVDEGAGWLVRFASPAFAYLKILGFLALQTSLAALIGVSLWAVFTASAVNYTSGERPPG